MDHRELIVINGAEVLARADERGAYWQRIRAGGATAFAATTGRAQLPAWFRRFRDDDTLLHVTEPRHIREAKAAGRLGVIFHAQKPPLELADDPDEAWNLQRLGIRMLQLTYNEHSPFGDGCTEPTDAGLSEPGVRVVRAANEAGILIDVSHAGHRTAMDIIAASSEPVVASHCNADAVCRNPRNLRDEAIAAIACRGGVIGVTAFPSLVRWQEPTLEQMLDHIDHIAALAGAEHIGFGLDFCSIPQESWDSGRFSPTAYPPPPWVFPSGIAGPEEVPNLTAGLIRRGYGEAEVRGIMGANLLRLFETVWR